MFQETWQECLDILEFPLPTEGMPMSTLIERYRDQIRGVLSCYDRVIIQGTLPGVCHAEGMTAFLYAHGIRIFDYPRFAEPLRDQIRANAEEVAQKHGLEIEFIRKMR